MSGIGLSTFFLCSREKKTYLKSLPHNICSNLTLETTQMSIDIRINKLHCSIFIYWNATQQHSECGLPCEFLRLFQGICKVKTIYIIINNNAETLFDFSTLLSLMVQKS